MQGRVATSLERCSKINVETGLGPVTCVESSTGEPQNRPILMRSDIPLRLIF